MAVNTATEYTHESGGKCRSESEIKRSKVAINTAAQNTH